MVDRKIRRLAVMENRRIAKVSKCQRSLAKQCPKMMSRERPHSLFTIVQPKSTAVLIASKACLSGVGVGFQVRFIAPQEIHPTDWPATVRCGMVIVTRVEE